MLEGVVSSLQSPPESSLIGRRSFISYSAIPSCLFTTSYNLFCQWLHLGKIDFQGTPLGPERCKPLPELNPRGKWILERLFSLPCLLEGSNCDTTILLNNLEELIKLVTDGALLSKSRPLEESVFLVGGIIRMLLGPSYLFDVAIGRKGSCEERKLFKELLQEVNLHYPTDDLDIKIKIFDQEAKEKENIDLQERQQVAGQVQKIADTFLTRIVKKGSEGREKNELFYKEIKNKFFSTLFISPNPDDSLAIFSLKGVYPAAPAQKKGRCYPEGSEIKVDVAMTGYTPRQNLLTLDTLFLFLMVKEKKHQLFAVDQEAYRAILHLILSLLYITDPATVNIWGWFVYLLKISAGYWTLQEELDFFLIKKFEESSLSDVHRAMGNSFKNHGNSRFEAAFAFYFALCWTFYSGGRKEQAEVFWHDGEMRSLFFRNRSDSPLQFLLEEGLSFEVVLQLIQLLCILSLIFPEAEILGKGSAAFILHGKKLAIRKQIGVKAFLLVDFAPEAAAQGLLTLFSTPGASKEAQKLFSFYCEATRKYVPLPFIGSSLGVPIGNELYSIAVKWLAVEPLIGLDLLLACQRNGCKEKVIDEPFYLFPLLLGARIDEKLLPFFTVRLEDFLQRFPKKATAKLLNIAKKMVEEGENGSIYSLFIHFLTSGDYFLAKNGLKLWLEEVVSFIAPMEENEKKALLMLEKAKNYSEKKELLLPLFCKLRRFLSLKNKLEWVCYLLFHLINKESASVLQEDQSYFLELKEEVLFLFASGRAFSLVQRKKLHQSLLIFIEGFNSPITAPFTSGLALEGEKYRKNFIAADALLSHLNFLENELSLTPEERWCSCFDHFLKDRDQLFLLETCIAAASTLLDKLPLPTRKQKKECRVESGEDPFSSVESIDNFFSIILKSSPQTALRLLSWLIHSGRYPLSNAIDSFKKLVEASEKNGSDDTYLHNLLVSLLKWSCSSGSHLINRDELKNSWKILLSSLENKCSSETYWSCKKALHDSNLVCMSSEEQCTLRYLIIEKQLYKAMEAKDFFGGAKKIEELACCGYPFEKFFAALEAWLALAENNSSPSMEQSLVWEKTCRILLSAPLKECRLKHRTALFPHYLKIVSSSKENFQLFFQNICCEEELVREENSIDSAAFHKQILLGMFNYLLKEKISSTPPFSIDFLIRQLTFYWKDILTEPETAMAIIYFADELASEIEVSEELLDNLQKYLASKVLRNDFAIRGALKLCKQSYHSAISRGLLSSLAASSSSFSCEIKEQIDLIINEDCQVWERWEFIRLLEDSFKLIQKGQAENFLQFFSLIQHTYNFCCDFSSLVKWGGQINRGTSQSNSLFKKETVLNINKFIIDEWTETDRAMGDISLFIDSFFGEEESAKELFIFFRQEEKSIYLLEYICSLSRLQEKTALLIPEWFICSEFEKLSLSQLYNLLSLNTPHLHAKNKEVDKLLKFNMFILNLIGQQPPIEIKKIQKYLVDLLLIGPPPINDESGNSFQLAIIHLDQAYNLIRGDSDIVKDIFSSLQLVKELFVFRSILVFLLRIKNFENKALEALSAGAWRDLLKKGLELSKTASGFHKSDSILIWELFNIQINFEKEHQIWTELFILVSRIDATISLAKWLLNKAKSFLKQRKKINEELFFHASLALATLAINHYVLVERFKEEFESMFSAFLLPYLNKQFTNDFLALSFGEKSGLEVKAELLKSLVSSINQSKNDNCLLACQSLLKQMVSSFSFRETFKSSSPSTEWGYVFIQGYIQRYQCKEKALGDYLTVIDNFFSFAWKIEQYKALFDYMLKNCPVGESAYALVCYYNEKKNQIEQVKNLFSYIEKKIENNQQHQRYFAPLFFLFLSDRNDLPMGTWVRKALAEKAVNIEEQNKLLQSWFETVGTLHIRSLPEELYLWGHCALLEYGHCLVQVELIQKGEKNDHLAKNKVLEPYLKNSDKWGAVCSLKIARSKTCSGVLLYKIFDRILEKFSSGNKVHKATFIVLIDIFIKECMYQKLSYDFFILLKKAYLFPFSLL